MKKDILTIEQWLVSNLITTQEFILENQIDEIQAKDLINIIKKYAEYYHKAKIEAISDEEIESEYWDNEEYSIIEAGSSVDAIKWFKNKLLNDL